MTPLVDVERVRAQLKRWQERLLDLTRANPLLGLNRSRVSKLRVMEPAAHALLGKLFVEDAALKMPMIAKITADDTDDHTLESGDEPEYRLDPGDITFEGKPADLLRRLRRLHDNARTTLEERGVTTLHLSFGSLKWEDPVLGESSSPLWLVPCELTSQGPSAPLLLARADEEMQLNPALELYLRERHRVSLPAVPEDPAVEVLARFLDEARAAVREHGWKVEDEVWLSTYSFESLVLYQDLRALAEAAVASDVVIALARAADPPDGSEALGEDELDSLPCPERVPIPVLPVDSSQLKALTVARAGGHVVVHGPPGTGKSQTISNLIADALGENKKVLFVSAKMAALNVVHDRLALLGLGDFCLEAHSTKAGKASIIEDLKRTLGAAQDAGEDRLDEHLDDFLRIRDKLNDTVRELHRRREPLGLSAYRAIGEVERLRSEPEIRGPLPWDDPLKASRADLKEVVEALAELGSQADVFDRRATHPWRGLAVVRETPVRREALEAALMTVRDKGRALQTDLAGLAPLLGSSAPQITCDAATRLAGALADLAALDRLPPYWSARERDEMLATAMVLDAGAADAAELESRQADHDRAFRIPVGEALRLLEPAATQLESWTRVWTPSYWWWRRSIGRHLAQGATGDAAALRTYLAVGRRIREIEESFGGRQNSCAVRWAWRVSARGDLRGARHHAVIRFRPAASRSCGRSTLSANGAMGCALPRVPGGEPCWCLSRRDRPLAEPAPPIGVRTSAEESLTQELLGQLVDVALIPAAPMADGDDEYDDLASLDAIDDPVALAAGPDTAEPSGLTDERLALLLGRFRELLGPLADESSDPLVGEGFHKLEGGLRLRDREGAITRHTPRRFLAST